MATKLGTAFDVLQLFEDGRNLRLTLPEVAQRLGVSKSTASGILRDLADEGYLSRIGAGRDVAYAMGERFQRAFFTAIVSARADLLALAEETLSRVKVATAPLEDFVLRVRPEDPQRPDGVEASPPPPPSAQPCPGRGWLVNLAENDAHFYTAGSEVALCGQSLMEVHRYLAFADPKCPRCKEFLADLDEAAREAGEKTEDEA